MSFGFLFEDFGWDESGDPGGSGLGSVEEDSPGEFCAWDAGTVKSMKTAVGNSHRAIALQRAVARNIR